MFRAMPLVKGLLPAKEKDVLRHHKNRFRQPLVIILRMTVNCTGHFATRLPVRRGTIDFVKHIVSIAIFKPHLKLYLVFIDDFERQP